MEFKFKNLKPICSSMRRNNKSLEQFHFIYNHIQFDCILDIDAEPFEMMIGTLNHNFACVLQIRNGFITEMSDEDYYNLQKILNLNFNENHFTSFAFLNFIDNHVPQESSPDIVPVENVLPFRAHRLTDRDREEGFIFCGWLQHKNKNNGHVRNLAKTEALLGKSIADYCEKNDISSKWTNNEAQQVSLSYPWKTNQK